MAFKGNNYLAKGVITGILKIAKASLFSDLNNLAVYTMLDDALYTHIFWVYGMKKHHDLLDRAGSIRKKIPSSLKEMYNGYQIGKTMFICTLFLLSCFAKSATLLPKNDMRKDPFDRHLIG